MNILSLFDGISCGYEALRRAGISITDYYASEIDKYAIKVSSYNHPDIYQLGDVSEISFSDGNLHFQTGIGKLFYEVGSIDLLIGGSPCQGFSNAGKGRNFEDPRSALFWEYVRILREVQPRYFLLENVVMKQEWQDIISEALGVEPIMIDSALVSAATRKRLYWTNIPNIVQPEDKRITFGQVRETISDPESPYYYSQKALDWIKRHSERTGKNLKIVGDGDKMQMLEASMYKKYSSQRFFGIEDVHGLRYISVRECERCMGLPDNYTSCVSNTQAYKQLGNGWNVDTIAHIFSFIEKGDL